MAHDCPVTANPGPTRQLLVHPLQDHVGVPPPQVGQHRPDRRLGWTLHHVAALVGCNQDGQIVQQRTGTAQQRPDQAGPGSMTRTVQWSNFSGNRSRSPVRGQSGLSSDSEVGPIASEAGWGPRQLLAAGVGEVPAREVGPFGGFEWKPAAGSGAMGVVYRVDNCCEESQCLSRSCM